MGNNFEILEKMTKEEWLACASPINNTTDLEIILAKMLA